MTVLNFVLRHWKILAGIAIGLAVWISFNMAIQAAYDRGQAAEKLVGERRLSVERERVREAERQLHATRIRLDEAIRERDRARQQGLRRTTERIENAPDFEGRYAAYLEHRNSLRNSSAQRHARAWSDYMSTVAPEPSPGSGSDRSELRLASFGGRSTLCDPA